MVFVAALTFDCLYERVGTVFARGAVDLITAGSVDIVPLEFNVLSAFAFGFKVVDLAKSPDGFYSDDIAKGTVLFAAADSFVCADLVIVSLVLRSGFIEVFVAAPAFDGLYERVGTVLARGALDLITAGAFNIVPFKLDI